VGKTYAIPATNPFAANPQCDAGPGTSPCPEFFALGLRNPWRMNFDPATGRLYAGDVGEGTQEEIDLIVVGGNYGWDCFEGTAPFQNVAACDSETFVAPEAVHARSDAQAITGGAVYRGSSISGLTGFYVYGDFVTELFFAFDTAIPDAPVQRLTLPATAVTAFGQGRDGEIYVVGFGSPSIQRLAPASG
jgi:glucose/arabinose dehydrogenase